ncbi:MAG: Maf family protein [Gammaproteobacteria bacterium]
MTDPEPGVVLASTSPYRRALLQRLLPDFRCHNPDVDEAPRRGENPRDLAIRLARSKAATAADGPEIVIGSDQVAALGAQILGKPGNRETAVKQLLACSGKTVVFYTGVCVMGPAGSTESSHVDVTTVYFRPLDEAEILRYLAREEPYDCAGSFKAEGLGVVLMDRLESQDPTAIQGLPLIWLAGCLREQGLSLP